MTNFHSLAGSALWAAIAGILMLATFEPISPGAAAPQVQLSAAAPSATAQASS